MLRRNRLASAPVGLGVVGRVHSLPRTSVTPGLPLIMTRLISFGVLLGLVVLFGLLSFRVMAGFLLPMLLAAMLVVIFGPMHRWIRERTRWPDWAAAGLSATLLPWHVGHRSFCAVSRVATSRASPMSSASIGSPMIGVGSRPTASAEAAGSGTTGSWATARPSRSAITAAPLGRR